MYDKYLIVGEEFKNLVEGGMVTGFQFGLRLPYYRGVVLSLVGDTIVKVDGELYPPEQMTITVGGKSFKQTDLKYEPYHKWEFGDIGIVTVAKPGGLELGEHKVEIRQHMKISYIPGGFWGKDTKVLTLAG